jgi:hypothetical protein
VSVSLIERQVAYIVRETERAAAAGHVVELLAEPDPDRAGLSRYWARCSCGWYPKRKTGRTAAFVRVMGHVGDVVPLSDDEVLEARRVGLDVPGAVVLEL